MKSGRDSHLGEVDGAMGDRSAMQLFVAQDVDKFLAALGVERLAGNAENILLMLSCNRDGYVCIRQQGAVRVVDSDEHFADIAGAIGDDGGRNVFNMAVPDATRFGVPDNPDGLADCQLAKFGLVEVGADLNASQVGHLQQQSALLNELGAGDGQGIDGAGEGGVDIALADDGLSSNVGGLCVGEGCAGMIELGGGVAGTLSLLERMQGVVGYIEPLACRGYFIGRGSPRLLQLLQCRKVTGSLIAVESCAAHVAGE